MSTNDKRIPVVFILGCGHSGSTLLDMLLSAHPDVVGLGEAEKVGAKVVPRHPAHHCSCGKFFEECPFWGSFMTRPENQAYFKHRVRHVHEKKLDFLLNRKRYDFIQKGPGKVTLEEYARNTEALYRYALEKSGAKVIVDSSKRPYRPEALLAAGANIEPYILHLVRDGRGVVWSFLKASRKRGYREGNFVWTMNALKEWLGNNLKVEMLRRRLPVQSRRILYRDLVHDPEKTVKTILADLGLDPKRWNPDFRAVERHYLAGNLFTLASTDKIRADKSWREQLPSYSRFLFAIFAGWLNLYYRLFSRS